MAVNGEIRGRGGGRGGGRPSPPATSRLRNLQSRFRDRSRSTSMSSFSDALSPNPAQRRGALRRLGSRAETRLKDEKPTIERPGNRRRTEAAPIPALLPPPPGGFLAADGDTAAGHDTEEGFRTPGQGSPEFARDRSEARDRFSTLWSSKSFPRLIRGGIGTSSRDWTGSVDADGSNRNGDAVGDVDSVPGSGTAGQGTPARAARKRIFSSMPSPAHLRRSLSFVGSMSAIGRSASRVASGMMTPVRRRRQRREEHNAEDESQGRNSGSRRGGDRRGGGRHSIRPTNVSEAYDSPGQTGGVSPEDESPVQGDRIASGTGARRAPGSTAVTEHMRAAGDGSLGRDGSGPVEVDIDGHRKGRAKAVRGFESSGKHPSTDSGRRRSASRDSRKQSSQAPSRSDGEESQRAGRPAIVVEWSWEGQQREEGENGSREAKCAEPHHKSVAEKDRSAGRRTHHEGHTDRTENANRLKPSSTRRKEAGSPALASTPPPPRPTSVTTNLSIITTGPLVPLASSSSPAPCTPEARPHRSLVRERSFGMGTGGTATMFASSPQGARAARRARSFNHTSSKTPSVWAAAQDGPKRLSSSSVKANSADTEGSTSVSDSSASPPVPVTRPNTSGGVLANANKDVKAPSVNRQDAARIAIAGVLRAPPPADLTTAVEAPRTSFSFSGNTSLPHDIRQAAADDVDRSQIINRDRSPPPAPRDRSGTGVAVKHMQDRTSSDGSAAAPLTRRQKARVSSPPPSAVALARISLQASEGRVIDSDSAGLGDSSESGILNGHPNSRITPVKDKKVERTVDSLGASLDNFRAGLSGGKEFGGHSEVEQGSPSSAISATSRFSFSSSGRSASARSTSSRSSGTGDSELSVNTDSSESTVGSFARSETAQRRRAALIAAARKSMPAEVMDIVENRTRAGSLGQVPMMPDGPTRTRTRTASTTDPSSLVSAYADRGSVDAKVAARHVGEQAVTAKGGSPEGRDKQKKREEAGRRVASSRSRSPSDIFETPSQASSPGLLSPPILTSAQASPARLPTSPERSITRFASRRNILAASPSKTRLLSRAGAVVSRVLVRPTASSSSGPREAALAGSTSSMATKTSELPPLLPSPKPRLDSGLSADRSEAESRSVTTKKDSPPPPQFQYQNPGEESDDDVGMVSVQPRLERWTDDLPPAEMGALGSSLRCALCGAAESESRANSHRSPTGGGLPSRGMLRSKSTVSESGRGGRGGLSGVSSELEFQRCSRCRRGCCEECFRRLPVYCRGPRVVVPVCRDCFRPVDFENRWHVHLLAASRTDGRALGPASEDPYADATTGREGQGSPYLLGTKPSPAPKTAEVASPAESELSSTARRATDSAAKFLKRSLSNGSELFASVGGGDARKGQRLTTPAAVMAGVADTAQDTEAFISGSRPVSLPRKLGRSSSVSTWSSLGSAFNSLSSPSSSVDVGGPITPGEAGSRPQAARGGSSGVIAGFASAFALSSAAAASQAGGAAHASPTTSTSSTSFGLTSPPPPLSKHFSNSGHLVIGGIGQRGWRSGPPPILTTLDFFGTSGSSASIGGSGGRSSPIHGQGRHPSECPCGAAVLYCEVMGGHDTVVGGTGALVSAAAAAPGASSAAAAEAAKQSRVAAHKLTQAKAHAHLLTRGTKALAYARLQSQAFKFLRTRAEAAKKLPLRLSMPQRSFGNGGLVHDGAAPASAPASAMFHSSPGLPIGNVGSGGSDGGLVMRVGRDATLPVPIAVEPISETAVGARVGLPRRGFVRSNSMPTAGDKKQAESTVDAAAPGTVQQAIAKFQLASTTTRTPLALRSTSRTPSPSPPQPKIVGGIRSVTRQATAASRESMAAISPPKIVGVSQEIYRNRDGLPPPVGARTRANTAPPPETAGTDAIASSAFSGPVQTVVIAEELPVPPVMVDVKAPILDLCGPDNVGTNSPQSTPSTEMMKATVIALDGGTESSRRADSRKGIHMTPSTTAAVSSSVEKGSTAGRLGRQQENAKTRDQRMVASLRRARELNSNGSHGRTALADPPYRLPAKAKALVLDSSARNIGNGSEAGGERPGQAVTSHVESPIASTDSSVGSVEQRAMSLARGKMLARELSQNQSSRGLLGVFNHFKHQTGEEMLQLVKDREALFEKMITGPGITATKFPRHGKPRNVVLTLVMPEGDPAARAGSLEAEMPDVSWSGSTSSRAHASMVNVQHRSLKSLGNLQLVWNRKGGGRGSLRVIEVVDTLVGLQSQVLRPVSDELKRRAAKYEGVNGATGTGAEEDTYASLLTGRRSLDLKFPTPLARDRFLDAFKTFAWETDTSTASAKKPVQVLRYYARNGVDESRSNSRRNSDS